MTLPFTPDQFFGVFAEYNRSFWPVAVGLWLYALAGAVLLRRSPTRHARFVAMLLAVQWAWTALAYHALFFASINPAAWLFSGLFLLQSALFAWPGIVRAELRFSAAGSWRHAMAWILIIYSLAYPVLVQAEGHALPAAPTFGVPCPTTILTIGLLLAADPPWPRVMAIIPLLWALVAGSAALLLNVHTDLMLWVAAVALSTSLLMTRNEETNATAHSQVTRLSNLRKPAALVWRDGTRNLAELLQLPELSR